MTQEHISVNDGKYTVVIDNGKLSALRHGEPWQDLTGNNLVYWLAVELQAAREKLAALAATPAEPPTEPPAEQWGPWHVFGHPLGRPVFRVARRSLTDPKRWDSFIDPRRNAPALFPSRSAAWGWILAQGMSQPEVQ